MTFQNTNEIVRMSNRSAMVLGTEHYAHCFPRNHWYDYRAKELSQIQFRVWHLASCQSMDGKGHPRYQTW